MELDVGLENDVPVVKGIADWRNAIASIESAGSGGYRAIGPRTNKGDHAYGKYQVMGVNIPSWTKQALGHSLSKSQFLSDGAAQDKTFDTIFMADVQKYGNPQDAASVWFTGKPARAGAQRRDILGTTGTSYLAKFNRALGNPQTVSFGGEAPGRQVWPQGAPQEELPSVESMFPAPKFGEAAPPPEQPAPLQAPPQMNADMTGMAGQSAELVAGGIVEPDSLPPGYSMSELRALAGQYKVPVQEIIKHIGSRNA